MPLLNEVPARPTDGPLSVTGPTAASSVPVAVPGASPATVKLAKPLPAPVPLTWNELATNSTSTSPFVNSRDGSTLGFAVR